MAEQAKDNLNVTQQRAQQDATDMQKVRDQRDRLEFRDLQARVKRQEMADENAQLNHKAQEQALATQRAREAAFQKSCTHRQGGKNVQGARGQGHDGGKYAKFEMRMPNGEIWVYCTRCQACWKPGDSAKTHATGYGYKQVRMWPTTNEMAECAQFRIEATRPGRESREPVEVDA